MLRTYACSRQSLEVNGAGSGMGSDALPGQRIIQEAGLSRAGRVLTAAGMLDPSNTSLADAAGADTSYQLVPGETCLIDPVPCCTAQLPYPLRKGLVHPIQSWANALYPVCSLIM